MTTTTVEPTPITAAKKTASKKLAEPTTAEPAAKPELTPQEKLALLPPAQQDMLKEKAHVVESAPPVGKKPKLSYAERLKQLPPEEAAAIRARANAASKASKARAKGYDSPEVARAMRLQAQLSRNQEKTQTLAEERETIMAELQAIAEAAEQQAVETEVENEQA